MSTTETGRRAETVVATMLQLRGYKVLQQNFKTRWCEIDIVASKGRAIYFVEVKYRRSADWGQGLEYITPKKVQQMRFAAASWLHAHGGARGYSVQLSAAEVSGPDFQLTAWVEDIV